MAITWEKLWAIQVLLGRGVARLVTERTGLNMDKASSEKVMAPSAEQFKAKYGEKICGKLQGGGDLGRS